MRLLSQLLRDNIEESYAVLVLAKISVEEGIGGWLLIFHHLVFFSCKSFQSVRVSKLELGLNFWEKVWIVYFPWLVIHANPGKCQLYVVQVTMCTLPWLMSSTTTYSGVTAAYTCMATTITSATSTLICTTTKSSCNKSKLIISIIGGCIPTKGNPLESQKNIIQWWNLLCCPINGL